MLSVGDELVLGQTVDTNAAWLSARLAAHGIVTRYHKTVADDAAAITAALRETATEGLLVLVTGGIGPTEDDLTREALAVAMGAPLVLDPKALRLIESFFQTIRRPMPPRNRVQAMCPRGAVLLDNVHGTAPGIRAPLGQSTVYVMPGVPYEMAGMFDRHVAPALAMGQHHFLCSDVVRTFGLGESDVTARLDDLLARDRNPRLGTTVSGGVVSVRIRSEAATKDDAVRRLVESVAAVRRRLGEAVFGGGETLLSEAVVQRLREAKRTVATAESCTGGGIAKLLTDIPGASEVFRGGWVVYSNAMKASELQVPAELLERYGAVSEPVARVLAEHAMALGKADFGLAVTGIAGPGGGSEEKPVGLVWIALARREDGVPVVEAREHRFPGDRNRIRERTALMALDTLRRALPVSLATAI